MSKRKVVKKIVPQKKSIVLIAHDTKKKELIDWIKIHKNDFKHHTLYATGTTGKLIKELTGLKITRFKSGPLGGDMQTGALIAEGKIDLMFFFWDPLEPQPHDPDVKALLRIAVVWNIPVACNSSSADFLITSPLFSNQFQKSVPFSET